MSPVAALALALLAAGAVARAPGLLLLALLMLVTRWLSTLWSRRGLLGIRYERRLSTDRAVWGDAVELTVSIENRKLLPLAWLQADDFVTETLRVREQRLIPSLRPGYAILRNLWSLAPFEAIERRVHIDTNHRGRFAFEWVRLSVADVFGRDAATSEDRRETALLVRPRTVPVRSPSGSVVASGTRRARLGLIEDPSLFAGVRPFQPGDPRRRVHERASARIGHPVSKRFEPSTAQTVVLALDLTTQPGPVWLLAYDEELVESLIVAAASLARRLLAEGAAVGLALNAWTYSRSRCGIVPTRADPDQLARITDTLARASQHPSMPYSQLLSELAPTLAAGTLVLSISSQDPAAYVMVLRRMRGGGHEVRHIALGPRAAVHAAHVRRLAIEASAAALDPDWRTSSALVLTS